MNTTEDRAVIEPADLGNEVYVDYFPDEIRLRWEEHHNRIDSIYLKRENLQALDAYRSSLPTEHPCYLATPTNPTKEGRLRYQVNWARIERIPARDMFECIRPAELEDCLRLVKILEGEKINPVIAYWMWSEVSSIMSAQWLEMAADDDRVLMLIFRFTKYLRVQTV